MSTTLNNNKNNKRQNIMIDWDEKENGGGRQKQQQKLVVFCDDQAIPSKKTGDVLGTSCSQNASDVVPRQPLSLLASSTQSSALLPVSSVSPSALLLDNSLNSSLGGDEHFAATRLLHELPARKRGMLHRTVENILDVSMKSASPMILERSFSSDTEERSVADEASTSIYASAFDSESEYCTAPPISDKERHSDLIYSHPEYADDIYAYMRKREVGMQPKCGYMRKQKDINEEMRTILVDWLVDVTVEYDLQLETLHLAVGVVDRMLSLMECPRLKLQLVGSTSMMISSKFEEIYPPELKDFVYITDDTYTPKQVLRMERLILQTLDFDIAAPTSHWFAVRFLKICRSAPKTVQLTNYLLELSLLEYGYLKYRASLLAASAICLANVITGPTPWPYCLESASSISLYEMYPCLTSLLLSFKRASSMEHKAVFEKYADAKQMNVALLEAPDSLPEIC